MSGARAVVAVCVGYGMGLGAGVRGWGLEIEAKFHALATAAEERHRRQYAEIMADFDKIIERSAAELQFTQHRLQAKESKQMQLEHAISAGSARLEISPQTNKQSEEML